MATAGRNGVVKIGSTAIGSVRSWTLDHTSDTIDTTDRKSTRLNSSHMSESRMPSSA